MSVIACGLWSGDHWSAPESVRSTACFYESKRAVGKLFRAIELPNLDAVDDSRSESGELEGDVDDIDPLAEELHEITLENAEG